jgi:NAD(P)-dependent dehydrogenase (short-subunit alcohol dehydrogenase family)
VAASGSDDQGSPFHLAGRVAVVTGGTRGIGRGIAGGLLAAGAEVVVCGRSETAEADLPTAVGRDGVARTAVFVAADIRDPEQAATVMEAAVGRWGRLDVLVNNAGGSPEADAATASPRFATSIVTLNLLAPLFCAQAANAVMQGQAEGGSIINIGSVSGIRPSPGTSAYGAAKAGLINLTQTLAVEWAPKVRVNCISAGLMAKDEVDEHYGGAEGLAAVAATVPLGRFGTPDDIAPICLFLASPELSGYVSGSNLVVNGGGEWPAYMAATDRTEG